MDGFVSPLLALFKRSPSDASDLVVRPQWRRHFAASEGDGTFVVFDPSADRRLVHDTSRARSRFIPASTFEIVLALVGIELAIIADGDERFAWDGKPKPRLEWERDQTLATAMQCNAAWVFQSVARRIGREWMGEWIERLDYGNGDMHGGLDLFWLQGALRVSAMEQLEFVRRLALGELPMTQRAQRLVRASLVRERNQDYTLFAKGGAARGGKGPVTWWIGWVERKGRPTAYFAMNVAHGSVRSTELLPIPRAILAEEGFI